ncbi:hypothetical protein ABK040_010316 [Willaertia magna]
MRYLVAVLCLFIGLLAYALYPMFLFPELTFQQYYKSQVFKLSVRFGDIIKFRQELYKVRNTTMDSPLLTKTTLPMQYDPLSSELYLKESKPTENHYLLRIYQPKQVKQGGYPVMLYIHGGGWVLNHVDVYDQFCRKIAERGFVVVSIGYRKAPESLFPAPINDVLNALSWIGKNFRDEKYNANLNQLVISGDSAGGNIAVHTLVRLILTDEKVVQKEQIPQIHVQALFYPALHFLEANSTKYESYRAFGDYGFVLDRPVTEKLYRYYVGKDMTLDEAIANPYLSILTAYEPSNPESKAIYSKLPMGFVITAEYDLLRDEGEAYAKAITELSDHTVVVKSIRTAKALHGFAQFPSDDLANSFVNLMKACLEKLQQQQK